MSQSVAVTGRALSKKLHGRFSRFVNSYPPAQVSKHLRCILLDYIHDQMDGGLPLDFDIWLEEFYELFELLDMAAEEAA